MTGAIFDALASARTLRDAGFDNRQAEAVAGVVRHGRAGLSTREDLDNLEVRMESRMDARIAALRADIYRALWVQGAGIVATIAGLAVIAGLVAAFFG